MKDQIIKRSITELQNNGLKFSIDEVAKSLKISKKTIYKYFSTKEELAVAIYKTFYDEAVNQIESIENICSEKSILTQMLTVYFQSHCMIRKDIFNKYSLNDGIRRLAQDNHNKIKIRIQRQLPKTDQNTLMIILDGSLQQLCETEGDSNKVIEKLVTFLC